MVNVEFWNFPKMPNSTAVPGTDGTIVECIFKAPFSITNPVLIISNNTGNEILNCNLCKISKLNRYYFIDSVTNLGNQWEIYLRVDVMGSYRSKIGASTQYVVRSEYTVDRRIIDTQYPTRTQPTISYSYGRAAGVEHYNPFGVTPYTEGTYVLGVVSEQPSSVGAITYYAMTNAELRNFVDLLLQNVEWAYTGIVEIGQDLFKSLINPLQYIVSCTWFPVANAFSGNSVTSIKYGWYTFGGVTGRVITNLRQLWGFVMNVPRHPQRSTGNFLDSSPYTRHTLFWQAFGTIQLDPNLMLGEDYISVQGYIDAISGISTINIVCGAATVYQGEQQLGVPIQLAQSNSDLIGAGENIIAGALTGGFAGALSGIASSVDNLTAKVTHFGVGGCGTLFQIAPVMMSEFLELAGTAPAILGRPLCSSVQISTIPGYILCESPKLSVSATRPELDEILNYMSEGFYYE